MSETVKDHLVVPENELVKSRKALLNSEKSSQSCATNLASNDAICLGWPLIENMSLRDRMGNKLSDFLMEEAN
jgi:hypothetical protein